MSSNTLALKTFLVGLLEDNHVWEQFAKSPEGARQELQKFKPEITAEQAIAVVYLILHLRRRLSELKYDVVNTVIREEILVAAPSTFKEPAYVLAGGGVIKDGPKYAQWDQPYHYSFTIGSYILQALAGELAT